MDISSIIVTTALKVGVAPALLVAICTVESNLTNVHVYNDGGTPSYGACQIKKTTAEHMGALNKRRDIAKLDDADLRQPSKNVKVAALYLKYQLERYDGDWCKAVAAYNAGSYKESKQYRGKPFNWKYVEKVMKNVGDESEIKNLFDCHHDKKFLE